MKQVVQNASRHVPILLYGAPGIGKTEIVRQSFDHVEVVLASTMVEEDISGLPYREGDYDYRTVPAVFRRLNEAAQQGKTTCLFLDELDKARRSVADTLLTLIASRKVGTASLPENTCIIAAANPPEFGGGDGISDAMRSRFCVIDAQPSVSDWHDWAANKFKSQQALAIADAVRSGRVPLIDAAGEDMSKRITCPRTIAMIMSFVEEKPETSHETVKMLADGLLTANAASKLAYCLESSSIMHPDTIGSSFGVVRSAVAKHKTSAGPLRV